MAESVDVFVVTAEYPDGRHVDIEVSAEDAANLVLNPPESAEAREIIARVIGEWTKNGRPGVPYVPVKIENTARERKLMPDAEPGTATIELANGEYETVDLDDDLIAAGLDLEAREKKAVDSHAPALEFFNLGAERKSLEAEIARRYERKSGSSGVASTSKNRLTSAETARIRGDFGIDLTGQDD